MPENSGNYVVRIIIESWKIDLLFCNLLLFIKKSFKIASRKILCAYQILFLFVFIKKKKLFMFFTENFLHIVYDSNVKTRGVKK